MANYMKKNMRYGKDSFGKKTIAAFDKFTREYQERRLQDRQWANFYHLQLQFLQLHKYDLANLYTTLGWTFGKIREFEKWESNGCKDNDEICSEIATYLALHLSGLK